MSSIRARRATDTPREPRAEAADAAEADVHADVGDGPLAPRQQPLRTIEPFAQPVLMWRLAEQRGKATDQLASRKPHFARNARNARVVVAQALARRAEARERIEWAG